MIFRYKEEEKKLRFCLLFSKWPIHRSWAMLRYRVFPNTFPSRYFLSQLDYTRCYHISSTTVWPTPKGILFPMDPLVYLSLASKQMSKWNGLLTQSCNIGCFAFLTKYPELTFDYWAKKYGSLYSLWLGNQLFVIVTDPNIVKDLMVTNGGVFSSRKEMFLKSQTIFAGRGVTATPYDNRWWVLHVHQAGAYSQSIRRKHRRLANIWLHKPAVVRYTSILDHEATVMVQSLHHYGQGGALPINPQPHAFRCTLNDMLRVTFGIRTDTIDDPLVARALWLSREFMWVIFPSASLLMIEYSVRLGTVQVLSPISQTLFPSSRKFPGITWRFAVRSSMPTLSRHMVACSSTLTPAWNGVKMSPIALQNTFSRHGKRKNSIIWTCPSFAPDLWSAALKQ